MERSHQAIDEIKAGGYDVIGDLDDLMPTEARATILPDELPEGDLVSAAVQALADLLVIHHRAVMAPRPKAARPERSAG